MSNQYLPHSGFVGDNPVSCALYISERLYPVSPARVIILLEKVSSDQGSDALVITREQYYRAAAEQSQRIKDEYKAEIDSHLKAYEKCKQKRRILSWSWGFLFLLDVVAFIIVYVDLILLYGHLADSPSLSFTSHAFLISNRSMLITIGIAVAVSLLAYLLRKLISYRVSRVYKSIQPSAHALDQRLINQFRTIIVDLMRKSRALRYDPMLVSDHAPTLVEVESRRVFPSETFDEVVDFLDMHVTSAIGIAGSRGAGKSTLLRWLFNTQAPEWVTVYLSTPATYNAIDFARMISGTTANAILTSYQSTAVSRPSRMWNTFIRTFRPRPPRIQEEIARISSDMLNLIGRSRTDQWTTTGGLSAKGASLKRQKQTTMTERDPSHPELIAAFTRYLESYRNKGGRKILIAIDELDKLTTADDAIGVVNSLKDLFHLPNTHFVVSVSEDALVRFAMRGVPFRDVFDSAFDSIVQVEPPSPEDAWKLLAHRTGGFPVSAALFCYAWSGGLPRDLIRSARECVNIRRGLGRPARVAELAPPVVRRDVKDAIDAALIAFLQEESTQGVESMLALRRKLEDESIPLEDALKSAGLRDEFKIGDADQDRVVLLQRLALYVDLGHSIAQYFTNSFDQRVKADFDGVIRVTRKLARAKLALSMYPSEAEWLLSEALKAMKDDE